MRNFLILLFFTLFGYRAYSACSSPISRINASSNSVLTSSQYNTDLNTVYTHTNDLDGDCITAGTLPQSALESSFTANIADGLKKGCKVSYSNASTVSVSACVLGVDGEIVNKSTATTVTWGDNSGSSETANTVYYVYALDGSSGSTLNLSIRTTVPNEFGEDGSNNVVLGRLFNGAGSDIDQYSIDQWNNNEFRPQNTGWIDGGTITIGATTTAPTKGSTLVRDKIFYKRDGANMIVSFSYEQTGTTGAAAGSGDYLFSIPGGYVVNADNPHDIDGTAYGSGVFKFTSTAGDGFASNNSGSSYHCQVGLHSTSQVKLFCNTTVDGVEGVIGSGVFPINTSGVTYTAMYTVNISGWFD